ncbi:ArnT family glycosyltransferase [Terricaulis sp.]|uniref:ArnT family glycosyltransferase n=1 Tax=Terricaulis sp. TaxID=2768686 RepID=UPI003784ED9A
MPAPVSPALYDQFARGWRAYALVALIALLAGAFGAMKMPVLDRAEAAFAQQTRELVEAGVPASGGAHWLQAVSVRTFEPLAGRTNEIWLYRLPSVLGLALAALAALWGGAALMGQRTALYSAAILTAGMLVGFQGMLATGDALAFGFSTLAMAALARMRAAAARHAQARAAALAFWFATGVGIWMGGLTPLILATLTLVTLSLWERRVDWMGPLIWWPGLVLAAAIATPLALSGAAFAFAHEGQFVLPGYHLLLLPVLVFPATYALPAAARLVWDGLRAPHGDEAQATMRFLIAWAAPFFLLVELLPAKLPQDATPTYPALAMMCGLGLMATARRRWRASHPAGVVLFAVAGAVIVTAMAVAATFMPGDLGTDIRRAISAGLIGAAVIGAGVAGLVLLRRPAARTAVIVVSALALSYSLRGHILPEARGAYVSSEALAALTRARLLPGEDRALWVVGYSEPSLRFQTRAGTQFAPAADAAAKARRGDALLVEGRNLSAVNALLAQRDLAFTQAETPVRGLNLGNGERVALFVGRVEEAPSDD